MLSEGKIVKHFLEIVNSVHDVAQEESAEALETAWADLKDHLISVASGKSVFWDASWNATAELMDMLCDALRNVSVTPDGIEEFRNRIRKETRSRLSSDKKTSDGFSPAASPKASTGDGMNGHTQEENQMADEIQNDPKKLLEKAQEALLSGKGENAKELAMKAAELIAEAEAEEARKREETLKSELENLVQEESAAEAFVSETKEKLTASENELAGFNKRLADAQSAFEKRENDCQELKKEIESTEAEITSLREKQKQLRERFEEAIPARDAAKRECSKIENASGNLPSEVAKLREDLQDTEQHLGEIRLRKSEIESELENLPSKTS